MSRLGRKPVSLPQGVTVTVQTDAVKVKGPQGELTLALRPEVKVTVDAAAKAVRVDRAVETKFARAMHGTTRAHIANMIQGVTAGFSKTLEISGSGYGAKIQGQKLILTVGFTHPVELGVPQGLKVECPSAVSMTVSGPDRQKVGQFAAEIRAVKTVEPYNLKGIKYRGEVVKKKAGKAAVGATK